MTYWQGPSPWYDGTTVETGDPSKDSRVVATCETTEMAALVADALNAYEEQESDED